MKQLLTFAVVVISAIQLNAQVVDPKQVSEDAATNKANSNINNGVNSAADKVENGIKGMFKKKTKATTAPTQADATTPTTTVATSKQTGLEDYGKYDFVPGDTVLFEDNVQDESADEIPSKWKILSGRVEVRNRDGEKAIVMVDGWSVSIAPRLKTKKILPQRFTLEFDAMTTGTDAIGSGWPEEIVWEGGTGNMTNNLKLMPNGQVNLGQQAGENPKPEEVAEGQWYHVAIAVNETTMKVYVNKYRVLNAQTEDGRANSFKLAIVGISTDGLNQRYFKNFRLAAGGVDPYKQITTTGSFVARGIKFDYIKATMKPESMGELNRINALMKDHTELKFEIGGHTDSDGDDAYNMQLSQQRADAVKAQLVSMGIDAGRLTTKGYGKTKPISDNTSPEGKANNRRVEFVKK